MKEHSSQKRAKILTVLFVVMLLLPAPLWLLLAPHLDTTNYENRTLAAFPQDTGVEEWPGAFEDWLNDHAPFRNQFMSLNGRLNWALGTLDSSDVLLGKEHWLFLKDVSDSKSISDYQGLTAYSEEELADFVNTLSTLRDKNGGGHCSGQGGHLQPVYARQHPGGFPSHPCADAGRTAERCGHSAGLAAAGPDRCFGGTAGLL